MQALPFPSTARSSDLGRDTMLPDSLLAVVSRLHQTRTPPTPRPTPPHPQSLSFHSPLRYLESSSSLILWIVKQGALNLERNLVGTNK